MKKWIVWWNVLVGLMDSITGILLMAVPALTLSLMGLQPINPPSLVFLSWMGAFVFAIGFVYLLPFFHSLRDPSEGEMIWKITALVRFVIAGFVIWKIMQGQLEWRWITVAITDGVVAMLQVIGLRNQCWRK